MDMDNEVAAIIVETVEKFSEAPADSSVDALIRNAMAQLATRGVEATDARGLLLFHIDAVTPDIALEKHDGQESAGGAITLKELSLIEALSRDRCAAFSRGPQGGSP
jgi:hypothetical protein